MVDGITIQLFIKQDYQHSKGCVSSHKDIWGYKKHQLAIHYSSALIAAEVGDHGLWLLGVGLFSLWKQEDSLSWHELQTPGLNRYAHDSVSAMCRSFPFTYLMVRS